MALVKEDTLSKFIQNFGANTRKVAKTKQTKGYISARRSLLAEYWTRYQTIRDELGLLQVTDTNSKAIADALSDEHFAAVETAYCDAMGELNDGIDELSQSANESFNQSSQIHTVAVSSPRSILPKIELPKFDGSFQKWLSFKDLFITCVVNEQALSNVQRMYYLKSSLQGEPETMLRSLNVIDSNFKIAWDMLQQRYDNTRRIVKSYLRNIVKLPPMTSESDTSMRKLLDTVTEAVRGLQQLGRPTTQWDDWLVFLITEKLDPVTLKVWEMSLGPPTEMPAYDELTTFLTKRIQGLEAMGASVKTKPKDMGQNHAQYHQTVRSHQTNLGRCPCCMGKHAIMYCPDFRKKSLPVKLELVHTAKLCKNCLKAGHIVNECTSSYTCLKCSQKHHTLLHDTLSTPITAHHARSGATAQDEPLSSMLLGTAVVRTRSPSGHDIHFRALLDNGSQSSFISEFAAQQLQLRRTRLQVPITGIGGCSVGKSKGIVQFTLQSRTEPEFNLNCSALVLPRLGHLIPLKRVDPTPYSEFLDLPLADPNFNEPGSIDIIIGADLYGLLLRGEIKRAANSYSTAQNTHLGWVIYGHLPNATTLSLNTTFCATTTIELDNLVKQLWKFNELDDVESCSKMTQDEIYCEKFFERTVRRDSSGRYQVQYPFKESCDLALLSNSKLDALKLFAYQESRLKTDAKMNEMYSAFMAEYTNLGHMEPVPPSDNSYPVCYLPHHGVYKDSSTTTKLRTVFNASRKYQTGVSLNDCLHVGPKLQNDLSPIILKWRMHRIAFMADIEKCYRQILVSQADADMQRIIWRNEYGKPTTFRLLTVTYGLNCSPYLTIKVLHTLADDEKQNFPTASRVVRDSFYMDDCLHGADSVDDAIDIQQQLQQLLQRGGFNLRKWCSNSADFRHRLSTQGSHADLCCNLNLDRETKALGIYWLCDTDSITYRANITPVSGSITKRQQFSDVAKIYDPPGLLAPVVVKGKAICQQLWLTGCDWDDPIPEPFQQEWKRFREEIARIENLKIPRWVGVSPSIRSYQLHVFSDASTVAYAAVAYLRVEDLDNNIKISILTAKTKVAPLKKITIPCLELNGALLAAKLTGKVLSTLEIPTIQVYCWSDSKTTLSWIRSSPGKHKQYISNRVTQIQELADISRWNYVPTTSNPADMASRGVLPSQLASLVLWWNGPPWLNRPRREWPKQTKISLDPNHIEVVSLVTSPTKPTATLAASLLQKYSNIHTLLAITSWCQRFIAVKLKRPHATDSWCTAEERTSALNFWIRYVQHIHFAPEITCLRNQKPISSKSKLLKLNPILDDGGLLRLNGRLKNANLPFNERYPFILPKGDPLGILLIKQAHEHTMHGGVQASLNFLRRRYWMIDARSAIKSYIHRCIRCFRYRGVPANQIMGSLPPQRCNVSRAFSHCGVDYGGPYQIRTTKGRGHKSYKGYVALFVCFSTRAIHLELVSDLSTATFLAALRRFFAQRGYSEDIYSDCATTFVGANSELRADVVALKQQFNEAAHYAASRGVSWHFIPPGSPNFGGIWEAGIKSMKHHLKRVIGNATLTFEEFYTVLKQVEAVLNSRPLTALTDDVTDFTALTPGHFLVGGPLTAAPEPTLLDVNPNRLKRWKQLQQMYHHFWNRWSCEYLRELQTRRKWHQTNANVSPGDLVLIYDERSPPTQWMLGRILETHPGADDVVRVVTIRTANSILKRAISKIVVLPLENNDVHTVGGS